MKPFIFDIDQQSPAIVTRLMELSTTNIANFKKLQRYYEGKHDILSRSMVDANKPNNRLVHNFAKYIVSIIQGYFIGKPVNYASGNTQFLTIINDTFEYNDEQSHNATLANISAVKGTSYELLYLDSDSSIRFTALDPDNVILVYSTDLGGEPILGIRTYSSVDILTSSITLEVEVYDAENVYYYEKGPTASNLTLLDTIPHFWGAVPIIEYPNNAERQGDFEGVIPLIDAYNLAQSDGLNNQEYFSNAYLKLINMGGTDTQDIQDMRDSRVILLGENGDADWLIKPANDVEQENFKNRVITDIHLFASIPNLLDSAFSGNVSGVALKYKLASMEQLAANKERLFKRAVQRRIELVSNMLSIKNIGSFNYRDIDLTFTRNIPQNEKDLIDSAEKLMTIVSEETALSILPMVDNPLDEIKKKRKEQAEKAQASAPIQPPVNPSF